MRLSYDRYGNMTSEKWYDEDDNPTYEYTYSYDGEGNIVKTIDKAVRAKKWQELILPFYVMRINS